MHFMCKVSDKKNKTVNLPFSRNPFGYSLVCESIISVFVTNIWTIINSTSKGRVIWFLINKNLTYSLMNNSLTK